MRLFLFSLRLVAAGLTIYVIVKIEIQVYLYSVIKM